MYNMVILSWHKMTNVTKSEKFKTFSAEMLFFEKSFAIIHVGKICHFGKIPAAAQYV